MVVKKKKSISTQSSISTKKLILSVHLILTLWRFILKYFRHLSGNLKSVRGSYYLKGGGGGGLQLEPIFHIFKVAFLSKSNIFGLSVLKLVVVRTFLPKKDVTGAMVTVAILDNIAKFQNAKTFFAFGSIIL